jgi:hypothetical protein
VVFGQRDRGVNCSRGRRGLLFRTLQHFLYRNRNPHYLGVASHAVGRLGQNLCSEAAGRGGRIARSLKMALQTNDTQNGIDNLHSGFPLLFPQRNSQDDPNGRQRQVHSPIQRSDAPLASRRMVQLAASLAALGTSFETLRSARLLRTTAALDLLSSLQFARKPLISLHSAKRIEIL